MKILVIGNGFDLDHNLPTGYGDFINFCDNIIKFKFNKNSELINLKPIQKTYFEKLKKNNNLFEHFYSLLERNNLYEYFSDLYREKNWIDMEANILSILTDLDKLEEKILTKNVDEIKISKNNISYKNITKLLYPAEIPLFNNVAISITRNSLLNWLNDISIALEMYISNFINETPIEYFSPDIADFAADKVISFNYSNTYEKIYSLPTNYKNCNYIHGKAENEIKNKKSHIVLGITDPLIEHDKRAVNSKFEKYFQRITKKTSNEYKKWLDTKEEVEVAFFGHSLFSSDGDIIQELINRANKITIFYLNFEMIQETVMHLVEIIGKEKLADYVYSSVPKIEFKQQQDHLSIESDGIKISQDLARLRCFHCNKLDEVMTVADRIHQKIHIKDIDYFQSQKAVIELYYELISQNINITNSNDLLKIALQLNYISSPVGPIIYDIDKYKFSRDILKEKRVDFSTLINKINENNKNSYEAINKITLSHI